MFKPLSRRLKISRRHFSKSLLTNQTLHKQSVFSPRGFAGVATLKYDSNAVRFAVSPLGIRPPCTRGQKPQNLLFPHSPSPPSPSSSPPLSPSSCFSCSCFSCSCSPCSCYSCYSCSSCSCYSCSSCSSSCSCSCSSSFLLHHRHLLLLMPTPPLAASTSTLPPSLLPPFPHNFDFVLPECK